MLQQAPQRSLVAPSERSAYLRFLPAIYSENEFMGRFLMLFQSVLDPIEGMVDNAASYFDPATTPEEVLPWLASWVSLVLDESWPLAQRRRLTGAAVELFAWRGTHWGLTEYLRIYTGAEPEISEDFGGIPVGEQSWLGWNTALGDGNPFTFTVTLRVDNPATVNVLHVKDIIEAQKPAHAAYALRLVGKDEAEGEELE
jgi:phage tail-like protein